MDILNQFGVQPVLLAAQVVNFLILLFILKRFLYKPILKILDERKKKIADSLKNAEEIEKKLLAISEKEAESLSKAAKEYEKILKDASQDGAKIIESANKSAEDILIRATEQAKQVIIAERVKLEQDVRGNIAGLVFAVMQKVTGKVLTKKDQEVIIKNL